MAQTVVRVQQQDFDVGAEIEALRRGNPAIGAITSFIGVCRDLNDGDQVAEMSLEHYPGMTERSIEKIVQESRTRWALIDVLVIHRIGSLLPMEQIVLVVVTGAHRGETFAGCEFIMDYLKTRAPFWKKESADEGTRWVASRGTDKASAARWRIERN